MFYSLLKHFFQNSIKRYERIQDAKRINKYIRKGRIPWSDGYSEYKVEQIKLILYSDPSIIKLTLPPKYGIGIDERIVEYPWIFSNLSNEEGMLLDAGSTTNFEYIVNHPLMSRKQVSIFTFFPESNNYASKRISYLYGDLRNIPFKDNFFDEIICQSTLEHIDMDNSIYGYQIDNSSFRKSKSYDFLKAVEELQRILKRRGTLLITFPFGEYENHGFFQQFDTEMKNRIIDLIGPNGEIEEFYFKYLTDGWINSGENDCKKMKSYNPHTGEGKGKDGAAHSRAICCIKFIKN
jgi:SAM-dependent methyltransferase